MKNVLVLGAGMVARPLVRYLLDLPDVGVTVATRTTAKADAIVAGHADGRTVSVDAGDAGKLAKLVGEHDLAVSLLPPPLHPVVARLCVEQRKHMVTTSYASPALRALDDPAREAGVVIVNEVGVDPGLDHMSAMRVIDSVRDGGGRVVGFRSYCGGLPAPEANDNPFGYKFSWSPRGVFTAAKNPGRFLEDGKQIDVPGPDLFANYHILNVEGVGELEAHPNRDSLDYIDLYGLRGIGTMYRGTLRYPGWCDTMKGIVDLGLLDETPVTCPPGTTYAQFMAGVLESRSSGALRADVAARLGLDSDSPVLDNMAWLGLFSDEPIAGVGEQTTPLDVLAARMEALMPYRAGERDMLVLVHQFVAEYPQAPARRITSTMVDFGDPEGDSSMARTVGLPAAIATKLVLAGRIGEPGLHIPVTRDMYGPILDELSALGIGFDERAEDLPGDQPPGTGRRA